MITKDLLQTIDRNSLQWILPEDLSSLEVAQRIEDLAEDEQLDAEPGAARDFYDWLQQSLSETDLQGFSTEVNKLYETVLNQLFLKSFVTFDENQKKSLLKQRFVNLVRSAGEEGVKYHLQKAFRIYEFGLGPDQQMRAGLLNAITQNQQMLGKSKLKLKTGEEVDQTLGNWIKDYNMIVGAKADKHGQLGQMSYIAESKNTKELSATEKQTLIQILDVYDWLKFPSNIPSEYGLDKVRQTTKQTPVGDNSGERTSPSLEIIRNQRKEYEQNSVPTPAPKPESKYTQAPEPPKQSQLPTPPPSSYQKPDDADERLLPQAPKTENQEINESVIKQPPKQEAQAEQPKLSEKDKARIDELLKRDRELDVSELPQQRSYDYSHLGVNQAIIREGQQNFSAKQKIEKKQNTDQPNQSTKKETLSKSRPISQSRGMNAEVQAKQNQKSVEDDTDDIESRLRKLQSKIDE